MRYKCFRIQSYKGVKGTTVEIDRHTESGTADWVNETGKTHLLEAIYSFSPDGE